MEASPRSPEDPRPNANGKGLSRKRHRLLRPLLIGLGWVLLGVGLLGGLLPVIPGWPFGVTGAAILYLESRWVQRQVRRWRQRHPKLERTWLKARAWLKERNRQRRARAAPGNGP
ncbi:MAG: hypothetical protein L6R30_19355 [Thermoanaerobaculia bacterium]|nr:hypothetical protein [Thermoanaerobaculia bacterium]MCK6684563.1 hypothetical protein [Thermoanaerobaculia bacterium]